MHKTAVINVVGLTPGLIGPHTPRLQAFLAAGRCASILPVLPAVTCATQSTYLTGAPPAEHGIVGNGWYFRDECEIKFWRQSNRLVQRPKIWERAREIDPEFTCANMFWWYNMYSSVDVAVTPRPMYPRTAESSPTSGPHPSLCAPNFRPSSASSRYSSSGAPELHCLQSVDRRRRPTRGSVERSDVDPRVFAAPGLRLTEVRPG